jgi:hypothetical protein
MAGEAGRAPPTSPILASRCTASPIGPGAAGCAPSTSTIRGQAASTSSGSSGAPGSNWMPGVSA